MLVSQAEVKACLNPLNFSFLSYTGASRTPKVIEIQVIRV